jgi:hypothetical protein
MATPPETHQAKYCGIRAPVMWLNMDQDHVTNSHELHRTPQTAATYPFAVNYDGLILRRNLLRLHHG